MATKHLYAEEDVDGALTRATATRQAAEAALHAAKVGGSRCELKYPG